MRLIRMEMASWTTPSSVTCCSTRQSSVFRPAGRRLRDWGSSSHHPAKPTQDGEGSRYIVMFRKLINYSKVYTYM
jgi:hypothetical protein